MRLFSKILRPKVLLGAVVLLFFLSPVFAIATATLNWSPSGPKVKSPVTITVATDGDFRDVNDGIGCDFEGFTNWSLHLIGPNELFGAVMGPEDKSAVEVFDLLLGLYAVDIGCKLNSDPGVSNGQSNNPALANSFEVVQWGYSRTPSGFFPGSTITLSANFDYFADTGCDARADSWRIALYDTYGEFLLAATPYVPNDILSGTFEVNLPVGNYGTVEMECFLWGTNYNASMFLENGEGETIFSVLKGNTDDPLLRSPEAERPLPTITLSHPLAGDRAKTAMTISYNTAFLPPENGRPYDMQGLLVSGVDLYYSTTKNPEALPIIKDLPSQGEYVWDVTGLPEGEDYHIMVKARDNLAREATLLSEEFAIDHTPPAFRISVDPPVSRGEEVIIALDAEEELSAVHPPEVRVVQQFSGPITLRMKGGGSHYEAVYYPVRGFDGEVTVTAHGEDKAGNASDIITSGGLFYVGILPPPQPVIVSPLDQDVLAEEAVSISGVARADVTLSLSANGVHVSTTKPDKDGKFTFANVPVSKVFQKGMNVFSVVALDNAGHQSEPAMIRVKHNSPPRVSIVGPSKERSLSRAEFIRVKIADDNNDSLDLYYEISGDGGNTWVGLSGKTKNTEYKWRTMDVPDGSYLIRVIASDGFEKTSAVAGPLLVHNYLPRVSIDGDERVVTNKNTVVLSGTITAEKSPAVILSPIRAVAYRVNNAKEWHEVAIATSTSGSFSVPFLFTEELSDEGVYNIEIRAKDERDFYGYGRKTVVRDSGPPAKATISAPLPGAVYASSDDEDSHRSGLQFTVRGRGEPRAIASVRVGNAPEVTAEIASDGVFVVPGVTLREHGNNTLTVVIIDPAGNQSEEASVSVSKNDPPRLRFRVPREGRGVAGSTTVRFDVSDPDGDVVRGVTLKYRKGRTGAFTALLRGGGEQGFSWDTNALPEGSDYQLLLEATDGTSPASSLINVFVDHTPPEISPIEIPVKSFTTNFLLQFDIGATDALSGVEYVEYAITKEEPGNSLVRGKDLGDGPWYRATIARGHLGKSALAKIRHPLALSDGYYRIAVRAVDASGNISPLAQERIVVDTTPPHLGSFTLSDGLLHFYPDIIPTSRDTILQYSALEGQHMRFTMSLERDTKEAALFFSSVSAPGQATSSSDERRVPLNRDKKSGLWSADLPATEVSLATFAVSATDELGNVRATTTLGSIHVTPRGKIVDRSGAPITDARVSVLVFDVDTGLFKDWNGKEYGLPDTEETDGTGKYAFALPPGKYRLSVQKYGYQHTLSEPFVVTRAEQVSANMTIIERTGIRGFMENLIERLSIP